MRTHWWIWPELRQELPGAESQCRMLLRCQESITWLMSCFSHQFRHGTWHCNEWLLSDQGWNPARYVSAAERRFHPPHLVQLQPRSHHPFPRVSTNPFTSHQHPEITFNPVSTIILPQAPFQVLIINSLQPTAKNMLLWSGSDLDSIFSWQTIVQSTDVYRA